MGGEQFAAWMDEQMTAYRELHIPFIGYYWRNSKAGTQGGALYRLDEVEVKAIRDTYLCEPEFHFSRKHQALINKQKIYPGDKLQVRETGVAAIKRIARKLEQEFGTHVTIYQG